MNAMFFSKTENGTEYRIYLHILDSGFPFVLRSALDAADGVHGELVDYINECTDKLAELARRDSPVSKIGYEEKRKAFSSLALASVNAEMEADGWVFH